MILVKVTQEDIDNGKRGDAALCPIAIALRNATDDIWLVNTSEANSYSLRRIYFDSRVQQFIDDFDKGKKVEPFEFKLPQVRT